MTEFLHPTGLVFAEGSRDQVRSGTGGSLPLPTPFPERPEQPLQLAGYRPAQPGKPPACRGDSYAGAPGPPSASHREGHGLSAISKVEPAEEAELARRRASGGRSRRPHRLVSSGRGRAEECPSAACPGVSVGHGSRDGPPPLGGHWRRGARAGPPLGRLFRPAQRALPSSARHRRSHRVRSVGVMIPTTSPSWTTSTRPASPSSSLPITWSIRASGATTTWSPTGTM